MRIFSYLCYNLLGMAIGAFVISAIATAFGVAVFGAFVSDINPFRVLSFLFHSVLIFEVLVFSLFTWREEVRPALAVMREHKVGFAFALENHRLSRRFIRFKIAKPEGYDPWEREEFNQYVDDVRRAKRAD